MVPALLLRLSTTSSSSSRELATSSRSSKTCTRYLVIATIVLPVPVVVGVAIYCTTTEHYEVLMTATPDTTNAELRNNHRLKTFYSIRHPLFRHYVRTSGPRRRSNFIPVSSKFGRCHLNYDPASGQTRGQTSAIWAIFQH